MRRSNGLLTPLCFVAVALAPSLARADAAAAEALFREGRRLLEEGKIGEACPKLAESQAQDPSSGTLLNLALCHEKQNKLASAWADYLLAARLARAQGKADRADAAEKKALELEPRLPHLTVRAASPSPDLVIVRGEQRLGAAMIGTSVPVDPGTHVIVATEPGRREWRSTVVLAVGESKVVEVPPLEVDAAPAPVAAAPAAPVALHVAAPPAHAGTPTPPPASDTRVAGWVVGATGVALLAVGAGFGGSSLSRYDEAESLCPARSACGDDALASRDTAETHAWVANVALGLGLVGVGIGGYLVFRPRAQPAVRTAIRATPSSGGLRVSLERSF